MKKAIIIYRSKTGTTKRFGEQISDFLFEKGIISKVKDIEEIDVLNPDNYDYIFLGCWTSGFLFFLQKPENIWIQFARRLPALNSEKTILFTTYKIRTGSMFNSMRKYLMFDNNNQSYELKSRNGELNDGNKLLINDFLI